MIEQESPFAYINVLGELFQDYDENANPQMYPISSDDFCDCLVECYKDLGWTCEIISTEKTYVNAIVNGVQVVVDLERVMGIEGMDRWVAKFTPADREMTQCDGYIFYRETNPLDSGYSYGSENDFVCFDYQWLDHDHVFLHSAINSETGAFCMDHQKGVFEIKDSSDPISSFAYFGCDWAIDNEVDTNGEACFDMVDKFAKDCMDSRPNPFPGVNEGE